MVNIITSHDYTKQDVINLDDLLQKIDELLNYNKQIVEELSSVLNENKKASSSEKISDLVRRLAYIAYAK